MRQYFPKEYWEGRLQRDFRQIGRGAGFYGYGNWYNYWVYRARVRAFERCITRLLGSLNLQNMRVLEIGCGTGFWTSYFNRLGVTEYVGIDITSKSCSELSCKFPNYRFIEQDIGSEVIEFPESYFDCVVAFDVLFHITEDYQFERAIQNISVAVRPGGYVFLVDYFYDASTDVHIRHRSLATYAGLLEQNSISVVGLFPIFFLLHRVLWGSWRDQSILESIVLRLLYHKGILTWLPFLIDGFLLSKIASNHQRSKAKILVGRKKLKG